MFEYKFDYKYHCLNNIANAGLERFRVNFKETKDIEEAQGVLVRSAAMHDMELPDSLLAIARAGAGTNNIPIEECSKKGIVVFNTAGANANGVKELVFAGMFLGSRDIADGIEWVKENSKEENLAKITEKEKSRFAGTELQGKTLGIIGLGAIGVRVANTARHFGMEVLGYDPYVSVDAAWSLSRDVRHVLSLDDIYTQSDFITVHVPLMDNTKKMIDASAIEKMKDGVILLNFSRDLLMDEEAVVAGIDSGKIRRYVSDFPNPITAGHKGCIVIPHLGASTEESEENCAKMAVGELMNYLDNGNIKNSVNLPPCDMGRCDTVGRISIIHENKANMISQFTTILGNEGINIKDLINKSRGDMAYTMIDIEQPHTEEIIKALEAINGVIKVRVIV